MSDIFCGAYDGWISVPTIEFLPENIFFIARLAFVFLLWERRAFLVDSIFDALLLWHRLISSGSRCLDYSCSGDAWGED